MTQRARLKLPKAGTWLETRYSRLTESLSIRSSNRWVLYEMYLNKSTIWKVGIGGGEPKQITDKFSENPAFSPDGKQIACLYLAQPAGSQTLAILPSEGGEPIKTLPFTGPITNLRWTV